MNEKCKFCNDLKEWKELVNSTWANENNVSHDFSVKLVIKTIQERKGKKYDRGTINCSTSPMNFCPECGTRL